MTATTPLDGPRQAPASGNKPKQLVILLHGYGADGNDLIGLAPYWARALPDAAFVSPHAPEPCAMQPMGRQWWGIGTFSAAERLAGAQKAAPSLQAFIDAELAAHDLNPQQLALVGFSQGTMMALYVGLRRQTAVAGILGYSGALVGGDTLAQDKRSAPPVFLIHGDQDNMIPAQSMLDAAQDLAAAEIAVEWHISQNCAHSIAEDGLQLGGAFLQRCLASG